MSVKVIFHPESGRLFGAQIVGYEGVDKRIDLIASILGRGGSLFDLQEIEHAYAPPYSSAKDPVHIVGFVGENIIGGKSVHITWDEFIALDPSERFLVDVRTPEEFAIDTIEGAVNIPHTEIRNRLSEIPRDRLVVLFCGVGHRAYLSERILRQNGFPQVRNLSGGFKTYSLATQKQGNEDIFSGDFIGKDEVIYQVDPYADKRPKKVIEVNACGLQCPGPIMRIKREMEKIEPGDRIRQTATDPGFARDVKSWCSMTGNSLVSIEERGGKVTALVEKGSGGPPLPSAGGAENAVSLVVFSDDFDRALASFVIANGAASAGKKVTMFFTFWGLSVIKKDHRGRVKKDLMGRLFAMMLPKDSRGLSLSKMNMLGMGPVMMRKRMKSKNVDSLETMIKTAVESGVRMVGCQMSMDVMGVSAEELIDGVEIGGVAAFLEAAGKSQASLFV
jgi:peroxiredoxin family protein/TusA-related sulfurtransferase/rhodanese-related sulfurtransferase